MKEQGLAHTRKKQGLPTQKIGKPGPADGLGIKVSKPSVKGQGPYTKHMARIWEKIVPEKSRHLIRKETSVGEDTYFYYFLFYIVFVFCNREGTLCIEEVKTRSD